MPEGASLCPILPHGNLHYVEDARLDTGSRRLAIATVDVNHSRRVLGGALSLGLAHDSGQHMMGAKSDANRSDDAPEAQRPGHGC